MCMFRLQSAFLTKIQNCINKKSEMEILLLPTFGMASQNSWMVVVFPIQIFWMVVVFPIQIFWTVVVFPIQIFLTIVF